MPNSGPNPTRTEAFLLRPLMSTDLPGVGAIEKRSFPSPWSSGMFALEMSKPDSLCMLATPKGRPGQALGYVVFSRYDLAWHLMNIAVSPEYRRLGVASSLLREGLSRLQCRSGQAPVTLEVRPSNDSAIALYESFGFESYGFRKGYYPDNGEDALIMWKGDPDEAGVPGHCRPIDRHRRPKPVRLRSPGV